MNQQFTFKEYFFEIIKSATFLGSGKELDKAIDILFETWKNSGTIFVMGCGGSASTATHFASDLAKTTIIPHKKRFKAMSLVDNIPLVSAWTNDSGWGKNDVLVGFSVHGGSGMGDAGPWSQNMVAAMKLAKSRGAKILGFSGFDGGAMKQMANVCLVVPVINEVYGTPAIEAFHVVLTHGIIFTLRQMIKDFDNGKANGKK